MNIKLIDIKTMETVGFGLLSFFEGNKDFEFGIKRIYYIYDVPINTIRGSHTHKQLWQVLFCLSGRVEIEVDDGHISEIIVLDRPNKGLIIGPGIWRTMKFTKENSVLCVAASDFYNEDDYIRNYDKFIQLVEQNYWTEIE